MFLLMEREGKLVLCQLHHVFTHLASPGTRDMIRVEVTMSYTHAIHRHAIQA